MTARHDRGPPVPLRDETPAERERRIARSKELLKAIEQKIARLQQARAERMRALQLEILNSGPAGIDRESSK